MYCGAIRSTYTNIHAIFIENQTFTLKQKSYDKKEPFQKMQLAYSSSLIFVL